ncbi:MAG: PadR family transcriptional regulator [candidate division Zixibacteria bacterium]|jgi:DNA-binding PadR family transcriptional regulator|nr:PadR family transcriptional regulator [candidate division Zixibacteria bacterium]
MFIDIDIGRFNDYNGTQTMAPTQTDYIILAYLAEAPEHGYRLIERMKRENLQLVIDFSVPNIYHSLKRLHKSGAVGLKTKKNTTRPDQKIYSLTDLGKEMLSRFLQDDLLYHQRTRFKSDLIFLLESKLQLEPEGLAEAVKQRIDSLTGELEVVQNALRDSQSIEGGISAIGEIAFRHQIRFLKNEIDFYRKLLKELK